MVYLENEINEQPDVLARLLAGQREMVGRIAAAVQQFDPAFVMIAARGSSDNAARYAQYALGGMLGLPVALATPSLHTLYETPPRLSHAVVIGISQSGQSEDVRRVLDDAARQGGLTVAVTNDADSPMARTAAHHIHLMAGPEISIAATKTYTAELTAVAMLVAALADRPELDNGLAGLSGVLRETLALSEPIPAWAERYRYMTHFASMGRGFNYCTAFEISLKIKELCYITGDGYSEADFRHGPIAVIQPGFPVITVAPESAPLPKLLDLLDKLHDKRAENLVISNDERAFVHADKLMRLPAIAEWLSPIVAVVPGQVLAMSLARTMGHPVDRPEGLTKVTVTE